VIFYYPANGNQSLAQIIEVLLYMYDNEKDFVMTAGVQADLKDYCLSQLAHLQSLQNTPSLKNFFYLHDRQMSLSKRQI
jgi:hypothetical protein